MNGGIVRIAIIDGPLQLLNTLATLFEEKNKSSDSSYEDYLVIQGTGVKEKKSLISDAIMEISKIWMWQSIINLSECETMLTISDSKTIRDFIGVDEADIIFATRNWQLNSGLLAAYPNAHKITVGDGLGIVDSRIEDGYIEFDEARLITPIEITNNLLNIIPYKTVSKNLLKEVIDSYFRVSLNTLFYCKQLSKDIGENNLLLLLGNLTEVGFFRFEDEINTYILSVLKYVSSGDKVVIKSHPRETLNQSGVLKKILEQKFGLEVYIIKGSFMKALPIEIICRYVKFSRVISFLSTSCISLKLLYNMESIIGFGNEAVKKILPEYRDKVTESISWVKHAYKELESWDGKSILYRKGHLKDSTNQSVLVVFNTKKQQFKKSLTYQSILNQTYKNKNLLVVNKQELDFSCIKEEYVYFIDEGYLLDRNFLKIMMANVGDADYIACGLKRVVDEGRPFLNYYSYPINNQQGEINISELNSNCILYRTKGFVNKNNLFEVFDLKTKQMKFIRKSLVEIELNHYIRNKLIPFKNEPIYIYGAGSHTLKLLNYVSMEGLNIRGIIDKNKKLEGNKLNGFKILNIAKIHQLNIGCILISSVSFEEEIFNELKHIVPEQKLIKIYT